MRILHTSDWHLGQSLHQYDRTYEHERFLDWLLDLLEQEAVDALLVAGDVFDHSNPSAQAQALLYQFLARARGRLPHLTIVLVAGNHDSPGRLEAPAPFLSLFNAHVVGQTRCAHDALEVGRLVVPLKDRGGGIGAWCIAMPFLRPGDVPRIDDVADPYAEGIRLLYRQALEQAQRQCEPGQALLALGHCHLAGGKTSEESERRIVIGGAEALSVDLFDTSIAYVALGHLHLPQSVGGDPTRRYSGSPLPLSFSEISYPHQVVLVDFDAGRVGDIRAIRVPRAVDLLRMPEAPAPLDEVLQRLANLNLPPAQERDWPYLLVRVRLDAPEPGLRAKVEEALHGKPVRLARIETTLPRSNAEGQALAQSIDELNALAPAEFFKRLYQHRFGQPTPEDLLDALTELLNTSDEAGVAA